MPSQGAIVPIRICMTRGDGSPRPGVARKEGSATSSMVHRPARGGHDGLNDEDGSR
jgi:hypothetical protein